MPRPILSEDNIAPEIREKIANNHADIVQEVQQAVANHHIVIVGMGWNPNCKRARKAVANRQDVQYLSYGDYSKLWRRRNALKMWTGWPTFPMVFVDDTLIGGANELERWVRKNPS